MSAQISALLSAYPGGHTRTTSFEPTANTPIARLTLLEISGRSHLGTSSSSYSAMQKSSPSMSVAGGIATTGQISIFSPISIAISNSTPRCRSRPCWWRKGGGHGLKSMFARAAFHAAGMLSFGLRVMRTFGLLEPQPLSGGGSGLRSRCRRICGPGR